MNFKALTIILLGSLALAGCGALPNSTPTPLPTIVLDSGGDLPQETAGPDLSGVTASGVVVPQQEASLASITGGNVKSVQVAAGAQVKAGQVLVTLAGSEKLAAAVEAARLELLSAQQALQTLKENAGQTHSAALLRLANAQKALDTAEKHRTYRQYRNGSQASIDLAQADLIIATDALETAEDTYGSVIDRPDDDVNRAAALSALSTARKAYDRALANYNYLVAMPNEIEVDQAEAELQAAQAEVKAAQNALDKLKDGIDPDALALAEGRLKNAEAQLKAAQVALADLELKAPFAGTVSQLNVNGGEWVLPAQVILVLVDPTHLNVETTDLSERDVSKVQTGQKVSVFIKALGKEVAGVVSFVSPLADTLGGDVVYKTSIDLDQSPPGLRAGMSVEVQFAAID